MPIYCNNYDINLYQGQSYFLDLDYTDDNDEVVDLNGATFEARMQVRRSPLVEEKLLGLNSEFYPNGVVGGGITGYYLGGYYGSTLKRDLGVSPPDERPDVGVIGTRPDENNQVATTPGVIGTGGITLNYNGVTGAFRIEIDAQTTSNIPSGRHFYDLDIRNTETGFVDKIITGTFEVLSEVTR
tara:strand:+ start:1693 stop:2244 length:552 start_codon:yes stop_codon:yes gene_type:complete